MDYFALNVLCKQDAIKKYKELFTWDETPHIGETSHLSDVLYIPRLHEKNIPPEWDTSHPS